MQMILNESKKRLKNFFNEVTNKHHDDTSTDKNDDDDEYSKKRSIRYGECSICNRYNTFSAWCQSCNPKLLTEGWTSGNETLDKLIKSTQIKAKYYDNFWYFQWIPYNDLTNIEKIGEGGFSTVYKAIWLNGMKSVNYENNKKTSKDLTVALKKLHDSQNISDEFLNEFMNYMKVRDKADIIHIYGLTQDPITKEYIFIMDYIGSGNLRYYLIKNFKNLKWKDKIYILRQIINGLNDIHKEEIVHRDFHSGNILQSDLYSYIADLGLSFITGQTPSPNGIYGVLPYVAPEVLKENPYTKASDIYSFGVLMSVVSTGQQPFNNLAHDLDLAIKICEGKRPKFSYNTPKFYIELASRCMHANPDKRPTAGKIFKIIEIWNNLLNDHVINNFEGYGYSKGQQDEIIRKKFDKMDKIEFDPSTNTGTIHSNAVYTSRSLNFENLPQPVNANKVTIINNNNDSHQIDLVILDDILELF